MPQTAPAHHSVIPSGAAWGPAIASRSWGKRSREPALSESAKRTSRMGTCFSSFALYQGMSSLMPQTAPKPTGASAPVGALSHERRLYPLDIHGAWSLTIGANGKPNPSAFGKRLPLGRIHEEIQVKKPIMTLTITDEAKLLLFQN